MVIGARAKGLYVGFALERAARNRPVAEAVLVAAATWTVLGGTSLIASRR